MKGPPLKEKRSPASNAQHSTSSSSSAGAPHVDLGVLGFRGGLGRGATANGADRAAII